MTAKLKTIQEIEKKEKILKVIKLTILYLLIILGSIIVLIPFYWMINTAMKSGNEYQFIPPTLYPKELLPFKWWEENFLRAMGAEGANFGVLFKNTIIVGVLTTAGTLVTTILASYAFARIKFKGREILFLMLLATMMIPGEMMTVTNFITVAKYLKWRDTFMALTIPFMASTFYIFFLRQSIKQIPEQLYQAAKIDGVGDFKFLIRIVIPIVKPTLITITVLGVIGAWSAYVWPNLITTSDSMRLISDGLRRAFISDTGRTEPWLQMAASTIVTLPLLAIFLLFKKYIIRGVSRSGIKG